MTKVIYYSTSNGENPIVDFLDTLSEKQQRKILRIVSFIKIYGLDSSIPHIKKLIGTPLWEIRILGRDNLRVLYVLSNDKKVILLHGFVKKVQKTPAREINIALVRFEEYKSRKV